jgi:hypothetical protein
MGRVATSTDTGAETAPRPGAGMDPVPIEQEAGQPRTADREGNRTLRQDALPEDLESKKVSELEDLAEERGVELKSDMRKAEIIRALRGEPQDGEPEKPPEPAPDSFGAVQRPDKAVLGVMVQDGGEVKLHALDSPQAREALRSAEGVKDEKGNLVRMTADVESTKRQLEAQKAVPIYLPQRGPGASPLPAERVQINDVVTEVPRGRQVTVPEEVARILKDSGAMDLR